LILSASRLGHPSHTVSLYIYDLYHHEEPDKHYPIFLGAATIHVVDNDDDKDAYYSDDVSISDAKTINSNITRLTSLQEIDLLSLRALSKRKNHLHQEDTIRIGPDQTWLVVVAATPDAFENDRSYITTSVLLFLLCVSLGLFVYHSIRKMSKLAQLKASSQKDRARLIVESARSAAKAERELNDFIAHEVRNPLAAA
jgi:signal transduction histidine kinase